MKIKDILNHFSKRKTELTLLSVAAFIGIAAT